MLVYCKCSWSFIVPLISYIRVQSWWYTGQFHFKKGNTGGAFNIWHTEHDKCSQLCTVHRTWKGARIGPSWCNNKFIRDVKQNRNPADYFRQRQFILNKYWNSIEVREWKYTGGIILLVQQKRSTAKWLSAVSNMNPEISKLGIA